MRNTRENRLSKKRHEDALHAVAGIPMQNPAFEKKKTFCNFIQLKKSREDASFHVARAKKSL
jgi:hypothetical protein